MLVYDHNTNILTTEPYGEPGMAYWHGALNHMKVGKGKGFLISLMAEMLPAGVPRPDIPERNDDYGNEVNLTSHLAFFSCTLPVPADRLPGLFSKCLVLQLRHKEMGSAADVVSENRKQSHLSYSLLREDCL
jgi:hypothetical protein